MIVHKSPDASRIWKMSIDLSCPALKCRFPLPKKFSITMNMLAVAVVFRGVIAEKTQIKEISCARQKLEWSKIAFIERARVSPNPTDSVLLEKMDNLGTMPASMTKLDCKTKLAGKSLQKFP